MHNHQRLILCNTNEHTAISGSYLFVGKEVLNLLRCTQATSQQVQIKNLKVVKKKEPVHQTIGIQWILSFNARPSFVAIEGLVLVYI